MATAPDGYHKFRTHVTYQSWTHGDFVMYRGDGDNDAVCVDWKAPSPLVATKAGRLARPTARDSEVSWLPGHTKLNIKIWEDGEFLEDKIQELTVLCSLDPETMAHWVKEEVMKFLAAFPVSLEQE